MSSRADRKCGEHGEYHEEKCTRSSRQNTKGWSGTNGGEKPTAYGRRIGKAAASRKHARGHEQIHGGEQEAGEKEERGSNEERSVQRASGNRILAGGASTAGDSIDGTKGGAD